MAGAGYKLFNTGDVLTAAQVNTYLQEQVVMVFADSTARTTALSGVLAEGMVSYLKDTDALEIYSGSAWVGYGSGDITAVVAGTGLSGGATSGSATLSIDTATTVDKTTAQTLTNKTISGSSNTISNISLTTAVTGTLPIGNGGTNLTTYTTGDLPYASASNTLSKLAIGTTGQVLTVSGGVPTWAASAAGGKVLQVVQGTYSTATTITSATMSDTNLSATITPSAATSNILVMVAQKYYIYRQNTPMNAHIQLVRGSTAILNFAKDSARIGAQTDGSGEIENASIWSFMYLDSPATTSATTYKTQARVDSATNSASVTLQSNNVTSVMILMEIGA